MSYTPFPYQFLPEAMRSIVVHGAKAIGCDPSYLGLAGLCACGGIIGGSRRLLAKSNWRVPPILWGVILGESGSAKSPAMRLMLAPLRDRAKAAYHQWEADKQAAEFAGTHAKPMRRVLISDTTTEALSLIARDNPCGLLLARDELAGMLTSFDCYKPKGGGDEAFFLSAFDGESFTADRKKDREHVYVPSVSLSIVGTCQPGVFARLMSQQRRESGLLARFLVLNPPTKPKHWTEAEVAEGLEGAWRDTVNRLIDLEMAHDAEGRPTPFLIGLAADAKAMFREFFNSHCLTEEEETGAWRSFLAKAEQLPLRLALILHHVRWAGGETVDPSEVDAPSMRSAISLAKWFIGEAARVYGTMDISEEERRLREAEEWIRNREWRTTERDFRNLGPRSLRGNAGELLNLLAKTGRAAWVTLPSCEAGGRPSRELVLDGAPARSRL